MKNTTKFHVVVVSSHKALKNSQRDSPAEVVCVSSQTLLFGPCPNGLWPYQGYRSDFSAHWYQAGLKLCSGVENSSSHGLAWVGAWGSWAKIKFSHNNLFEKDAQEEIPLAAGDGTGWDRNEMGQEHKHSSFGAHFAQ